MLCTGCTTKKEIFVGYLLFSKKLLLHLHFGLIVANQDKKTKTRTLYIQKCSIHGAPRKKQQHMHVKLLVTNQNQKTKIKTLYILKTLYTGCSMNPYYSGAPRISRKKKTFNYSLWFKCDKTKYIKIELGHYRFSNCYIQCAS